MAWAPSVVGAAGVALSVCGADSTRGPGEERLVEEGVWRAVARRDHDVP